MTVEATQSGTPAYLAGSSTQTFTVTNPADLFGGTITGANTKYSSWFGYYTYSTYPFIYEYSLGYEYVFAGGAGVYLYDYKSGHFWYTQASYYPFIYDFTLNAFLYYYKNNTLGAARSFYNESTHEVISE